MPILQSNAFSAPVAGVAVRWDGRLETFSPRAQLVAPSRRFKFQKSGQYFIRPRNETFSVAAVRVHDPNCSPVGIHG
jgi:hypothetical protein